MLMECFGGSQDDIEIFVVVGGAASVCALRGSSAAGIQGGG